MNYAHKPTVTIASRTGQAPARPVNPAQTRQALQAAMSLTLETLSKLQESRVLSAESLDRPLSTI
ncbi:MULTISPECIES: hypothetical protein [Pseudomonas]|jgi:hypothetical protein|uniref:hypothetical protein n=1 Tax=Pseudomonas TaxID=286 RepID=UPI0006E540A4|nr:MULTISPECIES: hypothetical protein [Pseudomonas]KPX76732.1 Unknown protein sequence [Pseudomonas syringae pv. maculicola]MBH3362868.1 hypothetical protein [Pseudomonas sp. URMO17WK12:I11]